MNFLENLISKSIKFGLNPNETIIHQGPCNLFRDIEVSGGMLYLTNERLIFIPHSLNLNRKNQELEIENIINLKKVKTLWADNGLIVELTNLKKYRLVLDNREKWESEIGNLMKINN